MTLLVNTLTLRLGKVGVAMKVDKMKSIPQRSWGNLRAEWNKRPKLVFDKSRQKALL